MERLTLGMGWNSRFVNYARSETSIMECARFLSITMVCTELAMNMNSHSAQRTPALPTSHKPLSDYKVLRHIRQAVEGGLRNVILQVRNIIIVNACT